MSLSQTTHRRAVLTALLVTALWSSSWVLIRFGLDDEQIEPLTFAGMRYLLAAMVVLSWVLARRQSRQELIALDAPAVKQLVVFGVVFFAVTQGAQFVAIDNQPAATTSLMLAPTALFVAMASKRSLNEPASSTQFVGAVLMIVGAVVYFANGLGASWVGMVAASLALVANVGGSLIGRSINRTGLVSASVVTAVSMTVGASILVTIGLVVEGWPTVTLRLGLVIAWLAVVNTAAAFTMWNASQKSLTAVESAAINNTMLVQIAALAWIFLDETPGVLAVVGIMAVSLGSFLTTAGRSQLSPSVKKA